VFGPSPRHYIVKVNRKARRAALRAALSVHADRSSFFGLDAAGFDAPSTKRASELIADRRGGSVLVILDAEELEAGRSFRNLAGVTVLAHEDAGVADIVRAATVVASQTAIDNLTARARKAERVTAGEEA
jgi:large subunit ribosomal protein L4